VVALLSTFDPGWTRLRAAGQAAGAVVGTLVTVGVLRTAGHPPGAVAVVGVVVAILSARQLSGAGPRRRLFALVAVPVITGVLALLGAVLVVRPTYGVALFVVAVFTTSYLRRFGGRTAHAARLALAPLVGMFVTPVPVHAGAPQPFGWTAAAGGIAVGWVCAMQVFIVPDRSGTALGAACGAFRHAAVRALGGRPVGGRARRRLARVNGAALTVEDLLDALGFDDGDGWERRSAARLRAAVLRAEVAVERAVRQPGAAGRGEVGDALDAVDAAGRAVVAWSRLRPRRLLAQGPPHAAPAPPRARAGRRVQPTTRLALQLGTAMAVAFVVGRLLFPERWNWTVITAFVVCVGARSRGDVVYKSGQRIVGALAGALSATVAAHVTDGHPGLGIAVIVGYLVLGLYLREFGYLFWAFAVTSVLAVLYGMHGDSGSALLVQRPEEILLGSACGIAAAWVVLPIRSEAVVRRRLAGGLASLDAVLTGLHGALGEPRADPGPLLRAARRFDRDVRELGTVLGPVRAHRALAAVVGRPGPAADRSDALGRCPSAVRELVDAAVRGEPDPALAAAVHASLRRARLARRTLAEPLTGAPAPRREATPVGGGALERIDTALAGFGKEPPAQEPRLTGGRRASG
jgi:Fusaric acid resistance protein-like